jgi:hypothetical protein
MLTLKEHGWLDHVSQESDNPVPIQDLALFKEPLAPP